MATVYGQLGVIRGVDQGKRWLLKASEDDDIGRSSENHVALHDKAVSKRHALVECVDGLWFIQDLGSKHGTWVNDEQIVERRALFHKDVIRVGKTFLVFGNVDPAKLKEP